MYQTLAKEVDRRLETQHYNLSLPQADTNEFIMFILELNNKKLGVKGIHYGSN